jgi:hypothetical protein
MCAVVSFFFIFLLWANAGVSFFLLLHLYISFFIISYIKFRAVGRDSVARARAVLCVFVVYTSVRTAVLLLPVMDDEDPGMGQFGMVTLGRSSSQAW